MLQSRIGLMACVVAGIAFLPPGARGQDQPAGGTAAAFPEEERIRRTLDEPTSVEFVEAPLLNVVDFLKTLHGIPIEVELGALASAGIAADTPVTRTLKQISLRTALRLLLNDLNLAYRIQDDALIITTAAEAAKHPASRVYPVLELLPVSATSADQVTQLIRSLVQQRPSEGGAPAVVTQYGPLLIVRGSEETHREVEKLLLRMAAGLTALQSQAPTPPDQAAPAGPASPMGPTPPPGQTPQTPPPGPMPPAPPGGK